MRKKIDNRIRVLIENCVARRHRSMFMVVGDKGRDQIVVLHHMLSKAAVKSRPTVLWCYKTELGFSSNKKKRMRMIKKKMKSSGKLAINEDDPFELFISSTNIRYTYYKDTHRILGNTFGMCVLQDFEALTPNLLARTIETVEGGGMVVIILKSMTSLRQLYTMTMDVHSRYRTESHQDVVGRFNERFLLSLSACKNCMVIDDDFNVLPISSATLTIKPLPPKTSEDEKSPSAEQLSELKASLADTQPVGALVSRCVTLDQAKALLKFVEAISEKSLRSTVVMTAARGRGKSAALGLAMATAVGFGYSNIFVTAPSPENLKTLFDFIFKGFDALEYQEHIDYDVIQSTNPDFNKAVVRVNVYREHRQTIQYIHPGDAKMLGQAELVCIDEAAAIPLPLVRDLLGPYLIFMSSTINGYEGTGRSLSLKLVQQLRVQCATFGGNTAEVNRAVDMATSKGENTASASGRLLHEVTLTESIRYADGDGIESWLCDLLCLNASNVPRITSGAPLPQNCDLYYVNRDTLFSYHKASETFLQRIMSLYVASHYKNSPNDLQMLSDAPAHHIFVLLGPVTPSSGTLPEVLCILQVCLEGEISKQSIMNSLSRGKRAAGDLIPWTISQQFQDHDFAGLSGARIVRIATHPDYIGMGYGSRCLHVLQEYYEGRMVGLSDASDVNNDIHTVDEDVEPGLLAEQLNPRKNLPPLLLKLTERPAERLDYLGVSYGLTSQLLKFWKKAGYLPIYIRQTPNDLTGEHSCIMIKKLNFDPEIQSVADSWLTAFWRDFRKRFAALLSYEFRVFSPSMCLGVLQQTLHPDVVTALTTPEINGLLTTYDMKRLELYAQNMVDYHLITDLLPTIANLYFLSRLDVHLSAVQSALLLGLGLQHKTVDTLESELGLPASQLLGLFNRIIRKIVQCLNTTLEATIADDMVERREIDMAPAALSLDNDLNEAAKDVMAEQKKELAVLRGLDLSQYKIEGSDADWSKAIGGSRQKGLVSIKSKSGKRKLLQTQDVEQPDSDSKKFHKGQNNKKTKKHKVKPDTGTKHKK